MRRFVLLVVAAAIALSSGILAYRYYAASEQSANAEPAPDLHFATLDQRQIALASLRGHWVLVNFWASWCAPCMEEIPHLVAAQTNYANQGLQIVGPALDDAAAVAPVLKRFSINYPVSADFTATEAAMRALGNDRGVLPYTVLIDPQGLIVERHFGGLSAEALAALLQGVVRH